MERQDSSDNTEADVEMDMEMEMEMEMEEMEMEMEMDGGITMPEDLKPCERKALFDLRTMLEESIASGQLLRPPHRKQRSKSRVANSGNLDSSSSSSSSSSCDCNPTSTSSSSSTTTNREEKDLSSISLWGVPLLPSRKHEGTDVILLKFLRAREFKAAEALDMLRKTLRWRKEFGVDEMMTDLENGGVDLPHLKCAGYMDGKDRDGHPVCYNIYGLFKDKDLYRMTFGNEERRERFLRWRVQLMEQGVRQMSLKPGGAAAVLHIIDFKDLLRPGMKELRGATRDVVAILQDNYPEFVAKNIFLNVSFRYYAYHALFSPFITPRTRSKFVFARPSKVTETLLKFISPENIPIQYGGLKREEDDEFSAENGTASELVIRGGGMGYVELRILEPGVTVVWDLTVVGYEVNYREEFIPDDEGSYKILIQEEKKLEECVRNSFYISEPGKVVLTIENRTYKRKRVLYRSKTKPTIPLYNLLNQTPPPTV